MDTGTAKRKREERASSASSDGEQLEQVDTSTFEELRSRVTSVLSALPSEPAQVRHLAGPWLYDSTFWATLGSDVVLGQPLTAARLTCINAMLSAAPLYSNCKARLVLALGEALACQEVDDEARGQDEKNYDDWLRRRFKDDLWLALVSATEVDATVRRQLYVKACDASPRAEAAVAYTGLRLARDEDLLCSEWLEAAVAANRAASKPRLACVDEAAVTCSVCLQLAIECGLHTRQCPKGHLICDHCLERLPPQALDGFLKVRCPQCRWAGRREDFGRCVLADAIAGQMLRPCVDCAGLVRAERLAEHKRFLCPQRPTACPACMAMLKVCELPQHTRSHTIFKGRLRLGMPETPHGNEITWHMQRTFVEVCKKVRVGPVARFLLHVRHCQLQSSGTLTVTLAPVVGQVATAGLSPSPLLISSLRCEETPLREVGAHAQLQLKGDTGSPPPVVTLSFAAGTLLRLAQSDFLTLSAERSESTRKVVLEVSVALLDN